MIDDSPPHTDDSEGLDVIMDLKGHQSSVSKIAWSPDGKILASASTDRTVRLWDSSTGRQLYLLEGHSNWVLSLAWSANSRFLASGSVAPTVRVWDALIGKELTELPGIGPCYSMSWSMHQILAASSGSLIRLWNASNELLYEVAGHRDLVYTVVWTDDGETLYSGSVDQTIRSWQASDGKHKQTLTGHCGTVVNIAISPDGKTLASGSRDNTIRLWDIDSGRTRLVLEGHRQGVVAVRFTPDGSLLVSKSDDGTVRVWRIETGESLAILPTQFARAVTGGLAMHPDQPLFATVGERRDQDLRICRFDVGKLFARDPAEDQWSYRNAKVALLGDSGVGKSGLALVLSGKDYAPTESTHGRHVWTLAHSEVDLADGNHETQEILLWDLAGQPGYRLIHQLNIHEITVAIIVFDARSETDPLAGIRYWDRALRQAQRINGKTSPMKKFLVAARTDRGGVGISQVRIDQLQAELGFDGYFETSARDGQQIDQLRRVIIDAIEWDSILRVTSIRMFQRIHEFLNREKLKKKAITTVDALYQRLRKGDKELVADAKTQKVNLASAFRTCIELAESHDLVRRFRFGDQVLLHPELLDAYGSAIVNSARDEPEGMGYLAEESALAGQFRMSPNERIGDRSQERVLLIATINELYRHELAYKEMKGKVANIVFPSQFTRELPEAPVPPGRTVVIRFEGPVLSAYTKLAVRLEQSEQFARNQMWRNAVSFFAKVGGECGIYMRDLRDGKGELTLYFNGASIDTQSGFEDYVRQHLMRHALPNSIDVRRIYVCPNVDCAEALTDGQAAGARNRALRKIRCPACDEADIDLSDRTENPATNFVREVDESADQKRDIVLELMNARGKLEANSYNVFVSYNKQDRDIVRQIVEELGKHGIRPWMDELSITPGELWQFELDHAIKSIPTFAVFIGPHGLGKWQFTETCTAIDLSHSIKLRVIPVILATCTVIPDLPSNLNQFQRIDFRTRDPDPIGQLAAGIWGRGRSKSG